MSARPGSIALGVLLIAVALLAFAPLAILGPAIGWPASLRAPAATQLALIAAHPGAVALGYSSYLLYSLLIAPALIGLAARTFGGLADPLAASVAAFAALSALARSIGILRWLTVMPRLAAAHVDADAVTRDGLELLFTGLDAYGGGIGEVLGVSLLMAASLATLCSAGRMPRWLAASGLVSAALLAGLSAPVLGGPAVIPVALAVSVLSAWMLAAGVWTIRGRRPTAA